MYRACYRKPEDESTLAWVLFVSSSAFATAAVREWTIEDALQPTVFLAIGLPPLWLLLVCGRKAQSPSLTKTLSSA